MGLQSLLIQSACLVGTTSLCLSHEVSVLDDDANQHLESFKVVVVIEVVRLGRQEAEISFICIMTVVLLKFWEHSSAIPEEL